MKLLKKVKNIFKDLYNSGGYVTSLSPAIIEVLKPPLHPMYQKGVGGFVGTIFVTEPLRKKSCKGCGQTDYSVKGNYDKCEWCGLEYERVTKENIFNHRLYPPPPPTAPDPHTFIR